MGFDYDNAERDILDAGGDPDYLRYNDPAKRDKYLRSLGMKPESYGGGKKDPHYKKGNESSSSEGCFLTSACTEACGLPDDCYELTTLRKYRDYVLAKQVGGNDEITHYYSIAPGIVAAINQQIDAKDVWTAIYHEMIVPCVRLIEDKEYDSALLLYRNYTLALAVQYGVT